MSRRPGYVHRSFGIALLSFLPALSVFQGALALAGDDAKPASFYQAAQDHADVECDHADPVRFDTCWRTALADFYRLKGDV